ncbi:sulfatase-like hydrolase/transferase [Marinilabilia rubra]|uniref:Sulfatase N-terminal domain-containing protein n=1 Tax=Marinilabilia rubra TaxID=2162893 RepID=A0A2U2B4L3_9BACT|nr:sulfatase-like hydrolase/transferase [Marinilabilia rubra]PWD98008.1 hypothetical protein DDZ16_17550 [Marinilabilia rubra]
MSKCNVLLITIDCLGTDKLLSGRLNLPFLSSFIKKGVLFDNMFATTSSTTPSIASIMTGQFPKVHGVISTYGHKIAPEVKTLAEVLSNQGYRCSSFVSGPLSKETGLERGFDHYVYRPPVWKIKFGRWSVGFKQTEKIQKQVFENLDRLDIRKGKNWFHWTHILNLHNRWRESKQPSCPKTAYECALESLDGYLEKLISKVDLTNTIVLMVGDHGHYVADIDGALEGIDSSEAHGFHVYDILTRVPFILYSPFHDFRKHTVKKLTSTIDLFPTLLDLLRIDQEDSMPGQSLVPLVESLNGNSPFIEEPVFLMACGAILRKKHLPFLYSIRKDKWKLVSTLRKNGFKDQLYNLKDDPYEKKNIVTGFDEIRDKLMKQLKQFAGS